MEILKKLSDNDIQNLIDSSNSLNDVIKKLGIITQNSSYRNFLKDRIVQANLSVEIMKKNALSNPPDPRKKTLVQIFSNQTSYTYSWALKRRLICEGYKKDECEECGILPLWNGKKLTIQLDHINGDHKDNRLENLRLLCPNCHSQTDTFCRGKKTIDNFQTNTSILKIKKFDVTKEQLYDLVHVKKIPYTQIGTLYGVSDNAIRKRCKSLGIEIRKVKNI